MSLTVCESLPITHMYFLRQELTAFFFLVASTWGYGGFNYDHVEEDTLEALNKWFDALRVSWTVMLSEGELILSAMSS